jgi:hypothetical protein
MARSAITMTPLKWAGVILLLPFLIPVALLFGFWHIGKALVLHTLLLIFWVPRDHYVLFVYSNSPNWKEYCEREILPQLPDTAVVMNWSERATWPRRDLSTRLFRAYAGQTEFNPLGIVYKPLKPLRIFRFWKPLRDAKHGKPQKLERLKSEFLNAAQKHG